VSISAVAAPLAPVAPEATRSVPVRKLAPASGPELADCQGDTSAPQPPIDLSDAPPFGLADIRAAIPDHCWERNALKSASYLARDVALVFAFAAAAYALNTWYV
jgi:hypothetical protein